MHNLRLGRATSGLGGAGGRRQQDHLAPGGAGHAALKTWRSTSAAPATRSYGLQQRKYPATGRCRRRLPGDRGGVAQACGPTTRTPDCGAPRLRRSGQAVLKTSARRPRGRGSSLLSDGREARLRRATTTARRPRVPLRLLLVHIIGRGRKGSYFSNMMTNKCFVDMQVLQMGRGSSRKNKKKATETKCSCLLFDGEKSSPLIIYLNGLANDIISTALPPGEVQPQPAAVPAVHGVLIPSAQRVLLRLTHTVVQELEAGNYFPSISETHFVVMESGLVKIVANNLLGKASDKDKCGTIHRLRAMIDRVLIESSSSYRLNRGVNPELSHWLSLMRDYEQDWCLFHIKYPFCLLPLSNRGPAFILMYDRTMDVVRYNDPKAYVLIVNNVEIPPDWDTRLLGNLHLADSLRRGDYDMRTTRSPATFEPQLAPLRYLRNRPAHAQEGAASSLAPRGVRFTPSDLAMATYIRMPFAFVSLQKSLHFVGELQNIDGFVELFPWRVQIG